MTKPMSFLSLSDLLQEYIDAYEAINHKVKTVYLGKLVVLPSFSCYVNAHL